MKTEKLLSIIIPAFNEERHISGCLKAITESGAKGLQKGDYEIIIVDNGSTDNTVIIAKEFRNKAHLTICSRPEDNIAMLRNFGVSKSSGRNLAFVDADCLVPEEWCLNGIRKLIKADVGAAGCTSSVSENAGWIARTWDLNNSAKRINSEVRSLPSGGLFVQRSVFVQLSGFDEKLETNEDFDLCYRIGDAGFRILSDIKLSVIHLGVPNTLSEFFKREKWHGKHVINVFLADPQKKKNRNAVIIAVYYMLSFPIIGIGGLLAVHFNYHPSFILPAVIGILILPASTLSFFKLRGRRFSMTDFVRMTTIYICYGMARATSLMKYLMGKYRFLHFF